MSVYLNYYYHQEANQFAFFRIPKALFTDNRFANISTDAKLLYGLMLDRMSLSLMNKWLDDKGRVYIYFTLEDACELMNIAHGKAVKLFAELDCGKGIGLIERKKQGQGRPAIIYLKNFASAVNPEKPPAEKEKPDFRKSEVKPSENRKSRVPKIGSADFLFSDTNKTDINKTEDINPSIFEGAAVNAAPVPFPAGDDLEELMNSYRSTIKINIEYDLLCKKKNIDAAVLDEMVELMVCTCINQSPLVKIGSQEYPNTYVKKRYLSIDSSHIEYVLESLGKSISKVHNIQAYLLTTLFNAPSTIENYYAAEVQHDLYGDSG